MEVHHHPNVEKKRFKEYFLEFLMIFLAVTLGFFAENIREKLSEHSKEREYILGIRKDLISDTVSLNIWIPKLFERIACYDSLISAVNIQGENPHGADMYYFARLSTRSRVFNANLNTISELKSSGNLRLISDRKLLDDMAGLQKIIDNYNNLSQMELHEMQMLYPMLGNLFDAMVFQTMMLTNAKIEMGQADSITSALSTDNLIRPKGNPQLRSHDGNLINSFIFNLHEVKSSFIGQIRLLTHQKNQAVIIIHEIDDRYNIGNE